MSAPIRILHVFGRMARAGAETRTVEVMRQLAPSGRFVFDYVALSGLAGELDADIHALGGRVHHLRLSPSFPRAFAALLRRERYDVVHAHVHYFAGYLLRVAAAARVPGRIAHWRTTFDGHDNGARRRLQRWVLRRWVDRYATDILAVGTSAMAASWVDQWQQDPRCRVIQNGIDLRPFQTVQTPAAVRAKLGVGPKSLMVLHVGRCDPEKNHLHLLEIFQAIAARRDDACLVLVGRHDTAHAPIVRARMHELGLTSRVIWTGVRDDVPSLLRAADVMVFPSLWEGLPGAVLEAAAAGLPTVGSAIPPVEEVMFAAPLLQALPLSTPPSTWAEAVLAQAAVADAERRRAADVFAASPFRAEAAAAALAEVWERAGRANPSGAVTLGRVA